MAYRKLEKPRTREEKLAMKRENARRKHVPKEHPLMPGQRFGRLVVQVCYLERSRHAVQCICDCGETVYPRVSYLRRGVVKSCGCYRRDYYSCLEARP